jgi:hypothetical protein
VQKLTGVAPGVHPRAGGDPRRGRDPAPPPRPFRQFEERVFERRSNLQRLVRALNADGKRVLGYGASTKGNVLLPEIEIVGG